MTLSWDKTSVQW